MTSQGFYIGPIFIYFYGIILMLGAVAATYLAEREARRRGLNGELVWDVLIWVLIAGIIGARIWHILTPPPSMMVLNEATGQLENPYFAGGVPRILDMLWIRNGGLGIPGAVIGGVIALYFYCRRRKLSFPVWLDIGAPALALGQAIGRWGNYVNQELYGAPTNLPWAITIDPQHRLPGYQDVAKYHPLFLYESLWNLFNMFLLLWLERRHAKRLMPGDLFLVYLIVYPIGRFLLEFIRLDPSQVAGLNANQTLMLVVVVCATAALIIRHRRKSTKEEAQEEAALEESH